MVGGCAPSPEFFEIFIPKWRIFVHSANDGVAMPPPGSALAFLAMAVGLLQWSVMDGKRHLVFSGGSDTRRPPRHS